MRRLFLILAMMPLPALAADEKPMSEWVQALCSVGGQTVYMAEKPSAEATDTWRDMLVASHPTGVCIFKVRQAEGGGYEYGSLKAPEPPHVHVIQPASADPTAFAPSSTDTSDPLATALKLLGSDQDIGATSGGAEIPEDILRIINASPTEMPENPPVPVARGNLAPEQPTADGFEDPGIEATSPDQTAALPRYPTASPDQVRDAVLRSLMAAKVREAQEAERVRAEAKAQVWRFATEEDIKRVQEEETRRMSEGLRARKQGEAR